jgi:hypothetical protein
MDPADRMRRTVEEVHVLILESKALLRDFRKTIEDSRRVLEESYRILNKAKRSDGYSGFQNDAEFRKAGRQDK